MHQFLRRSRILRSVRFLPYAFLYRLACLTSRVDADRYLFLSDTHLGFTGNFHFLKIELEKQKPDAKIVGVFKERFNARRPLIDIVRLPFLIASSGTVVLDDYFPMIYALHLRKGTRLVQVWHAVGAFKRVGHSRVGLPGGPPPGSKMHRNYTEAVVASEGSRSDYAEAFGIDVSRVLPLGVPRTDVFFNGDQVATVRREVRERWGIADHEKLVLFAPTFRGNGPTTARGVDVRTWTNVAAALDADYRVAVRQHPFTRQRREGLPENLIDASSGDMNEILMATDILITDYSSSIFEYALLRRPYVLYVPDLDAYVKSRSFYRPFEHYAAGAIVTEPEDLLDAIRQEHLDRKKLEALLEEFCDSLDGRSSERIVRELLIRT